MQLSLSHDEGIVHKGISSICLLREHLTVSPSSFFSIQLGIHVLNRGSYMRARVLLNLLNELGKRDKCEACQAFYLLF